jgi:hypothetical protein
MALRWSFLRFLIVSTLFITTARYAHANIIIPDATYEIAVSGPTNASFPSDGVGTISEGFCDSGLGGGCQSATATVNGVEASISGTQACKAGFTSCPTATQATAQVSIALFYAVIDSANPLDTTTIVPLLMTASLTTGVSGPGTSADTSASGVIVWGETNFIQGCTLLGASYCPSEGPSVGSDASVTDAAFSVQADTVQRIDMSLSGGTASSGDGGTGFTGTLDPLVEIDPSFLATHPGFSVEFSANIPTAPAAVPEPSSIALLTAGLFGLGFSRRKRQAN